MKKMNFFAVVLLITAAFVACKKNDIANTSNPQNDVRKIFQEKVEVALKSTNLYSENEINLLKESVTTFENKFRGFSNNASLLNRFSTSERQAFYEKVTGASLTIFNASGKVLINGKQINPSADPYKRKEWKDMAPIGKNDCYGSYDATCVTY